MQEKHNVIKVLDQNSVTTISDEGMLVINWRKFNDMNAAGLIEKRTVDYSTKLYALGLPIMVVGVGCQIGVVEDGEPVPTQILTFARPDLQLTVRERQLAILVHQGLKNKEIAHELGIREGTVKVYLTHLYQKLHIFSRTELSRWVVGKIGVEAASKPIFVKQTAA